MHTDRHLADRRNAILRILRGARVRRQEDLVDLLKADGFEVTQSSVSRDMRELGVLKAQGRYLPPGDEVARAQGDFAAISRFVRWLLRRALSLPHHLTDTQCGFKVYSGDIARSLFAHCQTDHFLFDVEILVRGLQAGYTVEEFPVEWQCDKIGRAHV